MASLRGKAPKDTFGTLLKLSETPANQTLQAVVDGEGTALPISISKSKVLISNSDIQNSLLTDTKLEGMAWPKTGAAPGMILAVNAAGTALEWATIEVPEVPPPVQIAPHILKANFVGAVTTQIGVSRFYPPQRITISGVYCGISSPGTSSIEVDVRVDGNSIFTTNKPSLAVDQHRSATVVVSKIVEPSSYITVDVTKASGSDLVVYIIYT